ncbi:hypothetical protein PF005_g30998, partial [Phytophthora fragariae]
MALAQHWGDDPPGDAISALLTTSATGDDARAVALLGRGADDDVLLSYRTEQALEHGYLGVAELLVSSVLRHPQWLEPVSELFWRRLLSAAMRSRQLSVLGFVLGFEPDLNSDVRHSEKPLFDAARADEAEMLKMLKMLLAHGADASGRDPMGSSVLHIAAKYGARKVLDVLKGSSVREEVFIALKLDEVVHWSLVKVLAPYFAHEALNLLETVAGGVLGHHMLVSDTVGASFTETAAIEEERRMLMKAVGRKTIMTALRIAQAVLIGMKVDGSLDVTSWWRVMTPVWILVAYLCWYPIKKYINSTSAHRLLDAVFTAGIIVMLVAPFFLLADRLEGKR